MKRGITRVVRSPSKGEHRVKLYVRQIFIKSSDGLLALHRTAGIFREEPRSTRDHGPTSRDRGPIVARSWPDHRAIVAQSSPIAASEASLVEAPRSPCNPSPIAMQSRPDRHAIMA